MKYLFLPLLCLCLLRLALANTLIDDSASQWRLSDQVRQQLDKQRSQGDITEQIQPEPAITIGDKSNGMGKLEQQIFLAINEQNWPLLGQLLSRYMLSPQPDPSLVAYAQANLAEAQNNLTLALEQYQLTLKYLPQFTRGKMDYARARFKNFENKEAKQLFLSVLSPDLPPPVQHNLNLYLEALKRRAAWQFYGALDYFKDDNINLTSNASLCLLALRDNLCAARWSAPKILPSRGSNYTLSAEKFSPLYGQHGLMFRTLGYGSSYLHHNTYNTAMLNAALGYGRRSSTQQWFLAPTFETYWQGQQSLYQASGITAEVRSQITPNWQNTIAANWQNIQYIKDEEKSNNAWQATLNVNQLYALSSQTMLFGGVDYVRRKLNFSVASFRRLGLRIGVFHSFNSWLELNLSVSKRWKKFDAYNPLFNGLRKDTENFYNLTLGFPALQVQGIKPSVYVQHYNTQSTLPLFFAYRRTQIGFRLEKSF